MLVDFLRVCLLCVTGPRYCPFRRGLLPSPVTFRRAVYVEAEQFIALAEICDTLHTSQVSDRLGDRRMRDGQPRRRHLYPGEHRLKGGIEQAGHRNIMHTQALHGAGARSVQELLGGSGEAIAGDAHGSTGALPRFVKEPGCTTARRDRRTLVRPEAHTPMSPPRRPMYGGKRANLPLRILELSKPSAHRNKAVPAMCPATDRTVSLCLIGCPVEAWCGQRPRAQRYAQIERTAGLTRQHCAIGEAQRIVGIEFDIFVPRKAGREDGVVAERGVSPAQRTRQRWRDAEIPKVRVEPVALKERRT
jgi:hypothetical protein